MQWYFPMLSIDKDRTYNDRDFATFYKNLFRDGVIAPVADSLRVKSNPNGGMRITVSSGAAILDGYQFLNTEEVSLVVPVASTTQDRTDSVVVRHDVSAREITLVYKKGDTRVEQSDAVFELQLATIKVPRNGAMIYAENITDTRADEKVCGYSSPYEKVSVSGLESQYQDMLERTFVDFQNSSSEDLHILQTDFQNWFNNLQDQLTENQAGNLQNQLDGLIANETVYEITHSLNEEYPLVQVLYWEYGLGTVPLEEQPDEISFDGEAPRTIPITVEYPHSTKVVVKVPLQNKVTDPTVKRLETHKWVLQEGEKSLLIKLGGH